MPTTWQNDPVVKDDWRNDPIAENHWRNDPIAGGDESPQVAEPLLRQAEKVSDIAAKAKLTPEEQQSGERFERFGGLVTPKEMRTALEAHLATTPEGLILK